MIDWPAVIGISLGVVVVFVCELLARKLARMHVEHIFRQRTRDRDLGNTKAGDD